MKKLKSSQNGGLKGEVTGTPLGTQSSSAALPKTQENQPILVMLDTTVPTKTASPITEAQQKAEHEANYAKMIRSFAEKLGGRVEWHKITLKDGRNGLALFFPADKWS